MFKLLALFILAAVLLQPSYAYSVNPIDTFKNLEQDRCTNNNDGRIIIVSGLNDQGYCHGGVVKGLKKTGRAPHVVLSKHVYSYWSTNLFSEFEQGGLADKQLQIKYKTVRKQDAEIKLMSSSKTLFKVEVTLKAGLNILELPFRFFVQDLSPADQELKLSGVKTVEISGSMRLYGINVIDDRRVPRFIRTTL